MSVFSLLIIVIISAFLTVIIRQYRPEFAVAMTLVTGIVILASLVSVLSPFISRINTLIEGSGMSEEYITILFKALGICILTQLASDTCKDANETALAGKAVLIGKVFLVIIALPLFENLAKLALSLLNGEY